MIVLEGPDNAGKSTLGKQLSERFGGEVYHSSDPKMSYEQLRDKMRAIIGDPRRDAIYDRVPLISEGIYGSVLRGVNRFNNHEGAGLWQLFAAAKPLIIYCRPTDETISVGLEFKPGETEDHIAAVRQKHLVIAHAYDQLMESLAYQTGGDFNVYVYNWTLPRAYDKVFARCVRYITEE